jgi:hypothetical protein
MKYMLLTYGIPATGANIDGTEDTLLAEIVETGEWVDRAPLANPALTRTVRVLDGAVGTTDGPFAAVAEQLTGYWLVDCESMGRAIELAALLPVAGTVAIEVRPLMDPSGMEM